MRPGTRLLLQRSIISVGLGLAAAGALAGCAKAEAEKADEGPADATCGKKGLPDCPLQDWMKKNVKTAMDESNMEKLAKAMDELAAHPPQGFEGWDKSATATAEAARRGDIKEVKAECKRCHDQHRSRFRKEMRTTKLL